MTGTEAVPARLRRILYVVVVTINAAAITARGLGYIDGAQADAIVNGLSILAAGLALGYVPRRTASALIVETLDGAGRHRATD